MRRRLAMSAFGWAGAGSRSSSHLARHGHLRAAAGAQAEHSAAAVLHQGTGRGKASPAWRGSAHSILARSPPWLESIGDEDGELYHRGAALSRLNISDFRAVLWYILKDAAHEKPTSDFRRRLALRDRGRRLGRPDRPRPAPAGRHAQAPTRRRSRRCIPTGVPPATTCPSRRKRATPRAEWQRTVNTMLTKYHASDSITSPEAAQIVDYLATFAPKPSAPAAGGAAATRGRRTKTDVWTDAPAATASSTLSRPPRWPAWPRWGRGRQAPPRLVGRVGTARRGRSGRPRHGRRVPLGPLRPAVGSGGHGPQPGRARPVSD